jgi:hypothetical protein
MFRVICSHSGLVRRSDTTRPRSWQSAQRVSTSSLPAPSGSRTFLGAFGAARQRAGRQNPRGLHAARARPKSRREIANQRLEIVRKQLGALLHNHPSDAHSPAALAISLHQERRGIMTGRGADALRQLPAFPGWQFGTTALGVDDRRHANHETRPENLREHLHPRRVRWAAIE